MDDIQEEVVASGSGSGDAGAGVGVGAGTGGNGNGNGSVRSQSQERHAPPSPASANQRARSTTPSGSGASNPVARPPLPPASNSEPPVPGIHRFPTMPSQNRARIQSPATEAPARPRGRSLSTQKADISHSTSVSGRKSNQDDDRMMAIPESRAVSPHLNRAETISQKDFRSPGLRKRTTTMKTSGSMRRNGTVASRRRPSLSMGQTSGAAVAGDGQSINFSLAGSPVVQEVAALNQPYVDPGYTQLNPAYDQPVNTRPVWGLAKPLPRVLRPGMVPTRSELKIDTGVSDNQNLVEGDQDVDLEQGRIEQTFKLNRVTTQLQEVRRRRESNLAQSYDIISPNSPTALGQQASDRIAPFPDLTPDEEEMVADPNSHSSIQAGDQAQPDPYYPEDAASATTEKEEADEHGDWVGEEIPLKAYDPQEDEIHNLHTHWSVIRVRFREPLAELLAVTVQLTLGFCADLVITTSNSAAGNEETTDWAWGLATMVGIYIAGGISGAHLNPAISIMLWIYRGFPLRKIPMYVFAQVLGAFLAALIAYGIFRDGILDFGGTDLGTGGTMGAFITYPRQTYIGATTAFFTEFTGTTILAIAVLAMGDDTNAPPGAGMSAFVIGLTITVLSMAFGYNTGLAMNPSRDFGPRLALLALGYGKSVFTMHNHYWVWGPWVATILGAIFGGFLYDVAIFVGGESPVNYPRRRMKRAATKWKRKWGGRIRNTTRKVRRPGRGLRGDEQRETEEFVGGLRGCEIIGERGGMHE